MPRYRSYDHRLKQAIAHSRNPNLFPELAIPRSTAMGWIRRGVPEVVTAADLDLDAQALLVENRHLQRERDSAVATQRLASFTFKLFGLQIQYRRLPRADDKTLLLTAIRHAADIIGLSAALHAIGLSMARFSAWARRQRGCQLDDRDSCPRASPTQLTPAERHTMRRYARDPTLAHLSVSALSWLAKRAGDVFASATTWCRLVRAETLRVPRPRVDPRLPRLGIRAALPGQIWHIDLTIVRLKNGARAFIQAVIDNASRYILAFNVAGSYGGLRTKALLQGALATARAAGHHLKPNVVCDSGTENLNADVDALVASDAIDRTVAQVDIVQSNSMIEAFFRQLKHAWLFTKPLSDLSAIVDYTTAYIRDHNELMPHHAHAGATPAEVFAGTWSDDQRQALSLATQAAQRQRAAHNRAAACGNCATRQLVAAPA